MLTDPVLLLGSRKIVSTSQQSLEAIYGRTEFLHDAEFFGFGIRSQPYQADRQRDKLA